MVNLKNDFPEWGEAGELPEDGFFYEGGDQVNEKHLDSLWHNIKTHFDEVHTEVEDFYDEYETHDATSDAHHTRYVDSEARNAVDGASLNELGVDSFTSGFNVGGNVDFAGNEIRNLAEIRASDTWFQFKTEGEGFYFRDEVREENIFWVRSDGTVEVPDGDMEISGTLDIGDHITSNTSGFKYKTAEPVEFANNDANNYILLSEEVDDRRCVSGTIHSVRPGGGSNNSTLNINIQFGISDNGHTTCTHDFGYASAGDVMMDSDFVTVEYENTTYYAIEISKDSSWNAIPTDGVFSGIRSDHTNVLEVVEEDNVSNITSVGDDGNYKISADKVEIDGDLEVEGKSPGSDMEMESGSFAEGYTDTTKTISFSNTYIKGSPSISWVSEYQDDGDMKAAKFSGWNKDSDGNIVGMDIDVKNSDSNDIEVAWHMFGTVV